MTRAVVLHRSPIAMTAEMIAKSLCGRKAGDGWIVCCPAHDDRKPSLSIRDSNDGKILVCCHAGCSQERVIEALRLRGLWNQNDRRQRHFTRPAPRAAANDQSDR